MRSAPCPLRAENLSVRYPGGHINALSHISFQLASEKITAIIGPNGAGKSTLIKASLGLIPYQEGAVRFFDRPLNAVRHDISYTPQRNDTAPDFPILVRDVVMMGLYSRVGLFQRFRPNHKSQAMDALEAVQMQDLANKPIGTLSGGQRQRVFLARALAQDATLYLMDEPFVGIDMTSFEIIMSVLKDLKREGKTILIVHHDLFTARQIFDDVLLINQSLIAHGPIGSTLSDHNIERTYKSFRDVENVV